jgi:hypothetical protein
MFSAKRWVTERFCQRDVLAHTVSTTTLNSGQPTRTVVARSHRRPRRRRVQHRRAASFTG